MPKLTELPVRRVLQALRRAGWEVYEGGRHYKLLHPVKPGALTVPRRARVKVGTLRAIIRSSGLTVDEFFGLYR